MSYDISNASLNFGLWNTLFDTKLEKKKRKYYAIVI